MATVLAPLKEDRMVQLMSLRKSSGSSLDSFPSVHSSQLDNSRPTSGLSRPESGKERCWSRSTTSRRTVRQSMIQLIDPAVLARRNIYKARSEGTDVATADLVHEIMNSSGLLIDFFHRARARVKAGPKDMKKGMEGVLTKQAWSNVKKYRYAVAVICQEALQHELMDSITTESKERGLFPPVDLSAWRSWGHFVRRHNRDVMCLGVEVHNQRLQWKLTKAPNEGDSKTEFYAEKRGRLEEFWSSYGSRSRVVNDRQPPPKHKDTDRKYGMVWDLQKGPQWRLITPAPGSLPHKSLPPREQFFGRDERGGMGFRSSSSPLLAIDQNARDTPKSGLSSKPPSRPLSRGLLGGPASKPPSRPISQGQQSGTSAGSKKTRQQVVDVSRHHYLKATQEAGRAPIPLHFVTGHSSKLQCFGQQLVDKELFALTKMLVDVEEMEEVDLRENSLITDAGLSKFLDKMAKFSILMSLRRLDLGGCILGGPQTVTSVTTLVQDTNNLLSLRITRIPIAQRLQLALGEAIGHHSTLKSVDLAETRLMPGNTTKEFLQRILESKTIDFLDLSWNTFDGEAFQKLGECVVSNRTLRTLRVANCATNYSMGPAQDFVPPLSLFLEQLSDDKSLTELDISLNKCDYRTALILEDSLDCHKKLKHLILDQNPLGNPGLRSILRLLSRNTSALVNFSAQNCTTNLPMDMQGTAAAVPIFSYTNPGGKYNLQLWRPYHRAMIRMLYKVTERFGLQPAEAFEKVTYVEKFVTKPWEHLSRGRNGQYEISATGDLHLVFCVEKAIFKRFLSGGKNSLVETDNVGFFLQYYKEMRFSPSFNKVVPLFAYWAGLHGDKDGQEAFIDALSKDFNLTLPHLAHMCESVKEASTDCLYKLRPALSESKSSQFITNLLFSKLEDLLFTHEKLDTFLQWNPANPTGHYCMELDNPSDYAVAERLLLCDRWEAAVDKKLERKDTSQYGNGSHLRNPLYQGRELDYSQYASVAEWNLPEVGTLEVDYASNHRAPKNVEVLSDDLWENLMVLMVNSSCLAEDRIIAMRSIAHNFWIRSVHMRSIIGYFKDSRQRADIFIAFYLRIVDLHNAKMFRVRFPTREEIEGLQNRLGYASFFPFFQPENAQFSLNLAQHDQRLCASMWVNLCQKEKYPHNIHDYHYYLLDGTEDPMPLGIPRSWASYDALPTEGRFTATYMCAPEFRHLPTRKAFAIQYSYLNGCEDLTEDDIQWWTGLTEPPSDVLRMLEFFIARYDNIKQPFVAIDGEDGNGVITLQELTEGLDQMGCHKFDKLKTDPPEQKTKAQRVNAIFRYLDPGCEGSISEDEWGVLGQLWREFDRSIQEFVQFLTLTFGDDLLFAWETLDDDDSGELSREEFLKAVENIGYFGPASVVFALLDSSDDGNISYDEFEVLEQYKPKRKRAATSRKTIFDLSRQGSKDSCKTRTISKESFFQLDFKVDEDDEQDKSSNTDDGDESDKGSETWDGG